MDFTRIKKNLENNGYKVTCFATANQAVNYLKEEISDRTVAFGGSVTLDEIGLYDVLKDRNQVFWHWKQHENIPASEILKFAQTTDVYICSANGIAETGEIVNIDGTGNRVSSIAFGHKKVIFIIGRNKISPNLELAIYRARNVAAPLNAKRLNKNTPCSINKDMCYGCSKSDRICNILSVFWKCPGGADYEVVLVDEALGY